MAKRALAAIIARARQALKDKFGESTDYEWGDEELKIYIDECLVEISVVSPYKVKEVLTTTANSKILDISGIENLLDIDRLEYPTGNDPPSYRNFNPIDAETIEIDTSLVPIAGGSGTLTGIITFTSGSAAITGSGTAFTSELKVGYHIKKSSGTRWYRIYSIESDTALTLSEPCLDTGADTEDATQYCYEAVYVFCLKVHELTKSDSTLNLELEKILIWGICGKAAIARAGDLINKVCVGGKNVPTQMQGWGAAQLSLFQGALTRINEPQVFTQYARG